MALGSSHLAWLLKEFAQRTEPRGVDAVIGGGEYIPMGR